MNDEKLRRLISLSSPILEWVKTELTNDGLDDSKLYEDTIKSLIIIEEIKKELEKEDPHSSKRFKQTKIKF
jgi:hypothetical protein